MDRISEPMRENKMEMPQAQSRNRRKTGTNYEILAEQYLRKLGYEILERNYYCRMGEIDLIARQEGTIIFCEVKYRRSLSAGHPLEAVTPRKQRTIAACAEYYLMEHGCGDTCCRFDVVGILGEELIHIPNAFSSSG